MKNIFYNTMLFKLQLFSLLHIIIIIIIIRNNKLQGNHNFKEIISFVSRLYL